MPWVGRIYDATPGEDTALNTEQNTEKTSSNKTLSKHCNCGWANDEHEPQNSNQTPARDICGSKYS